MRFFKLRLGAEGLESRVQSLGFRVSSLGRLSGFGTQFGI